MTFRAVLIWLASVLFGSFICPEIACCFKFIQTTIEADWEGHDECQITVARLTQRKHRKHRKKMNYLERSYPTRTKIFHLRDGLPFEDSISFVFISCSTSRLNVYFKHWALWLNINEMHLWYFVNGYLFSVVVILIFHFRRFRFQRKIEIIHFFFFCVTSLRWLNFCRIFSCSIFHFILLLDGIFQFRKLLSTFQNSRCFFEFSECSNSTVVTRFKLSCTFTFRQDRLELSWNTLDLPRKQNSLSETKVRVQRQTKQLNMQNTFDTHLSIFAYPFDSTSFQLHFTCEDNKIAAIIRYTCFAMCIMFTPLEH